MQNVILLMSPTPIKTTDAITTNNSIMLIASTSTNYNYCYQPYCAIIGLIHNSIVL